MTVDESGEASIIPELEEAELHEILANERRIYVVDILANERRIERSSLAREVAASETGTDVVAVDSDEYSRVYISLYQSHLPKLAEFGVITQERDTISPGPNFDAVRSARNAVALSQGVTVDGE